MPDILVDSRCYQMAGIFKTKIFRQLAALPMPSPQTELPDACNHHPERQQHQHARHQLVEGNEIVVPVTNTVNQQPGNTSKGKKPIEPVATRVPELVPTKPSQNCDRAGEDY